MDKSVRDIRSFVIKQMLNSEWSSEGRNNYYTNRIISIKKDFDKSIWVFSFESGSFHPFDNLGINRYILFILLYFVKRSDKKRKDSLKNDKLKSDWLYFLDKNKDIDRDNKIKKIIRK